VISFASLVEKEKGQNQKTNKKGIAPSLLAI